MIYGIHAFTSTLKRATMLLIMKYFESKLRDQFVVKLWDKSVPQLVQVTSSKQGMFTLAVFVLLSPPDGGVCKLRVSHSVNTASFQTLGRHAFIFNIPFIITNAIESFLDTRE